MFNLKMNLKKSERFLFKNAFMIGSVFVVLILLSAIFLCRNFIKNDDSKTLKNTISNLNDMSNLSEDTLLETYKKISYVASLRDVLLNFNKDSDKELFFQRCQEVTKVLDTYKSFDESILSVCVYSPYANYVTTSDGTVPFNLYSDKSWLDFYNGLEANEANVFFRKDLSGINVITFVYRAKKSEKTDGGIIIDIDIEKHLRINAESYSFLLLGNNNEILYANNYNINSTLKKDILSNKNDIVKCYDNYYAIAEKQSEIADFSYVIIEHLPNYFQNRLYIYLTVAFVFLLLGIFAVVIAFYIASYSYKPIREIAGIIENPQSEKSKKYLLNDSTTKKITDSIVMITSNNKKLRDELNERMGTLNYAQLRALQWQINPHFIFNTLNMMYYMIDEELGNDSKIAQGILSLSGIMRYSLKTEPMLVKLSEELSSAEKYISLMNARFDDDFEVVLDIDDRLLDKKIVRMCLQPVLENCFQYGLKELSKKGIITISAEESDGIFVISVKDNGNGMAKERLDEIKHRLSEETNITEEHIGLLNVHSRIVLISGKKYGIEIESEENKGTEVRMKFPDYK